MGIVRDITVEELKQAVNNIDTSTLAQDSTLQDVVTAIGNISGGSDPVTNTTVNSLCKDTTGQSIASAITALGSTLGSDKANISGDNIASPSVFRQNIGISIGTLTSANTKVSVIRGYFLRIANIIFIDAIFTANQSFGANEYLLSGQPSIGNNNYPLVCALAEGGANSNNLARLYASYIVANGSLTAGKSYHCFGSYTI